MSFKKLVLAIAGFFTLAACGAQANTSTTTTTTGQTTSAQKTTLTVGINASGEELWTNIAERLKAENIELKIQVFEDYIQPNTALENGDIDLNAFQTIVYLNKFNEEKGTHIVPVAYTVIAPMGIYAKEGGITSLDQIQEGAKIAIPNDTSNGARALRLLHAAGVIQLADPSKTIVTKDDIVANPKKVEIVELAAAQLVTALQDVTVSVINSGVAVEAKLVPKEDAIFLEQITDSSTPYYNVIAVKEGNEKNEAIQKIIKVYQTEETKRVIEETSKGASIPVWEKATLPTK